MRPSSRTLIVTILAAVALLGLNCATTGPGGKRSLVIIPTSQEVAIGAGMAEQVEETETVLPDSVWQQYFRNVGDKIVRVCDRRDIEYHFTVIESDQANAFAAPGGYIYIYTGLLKQMESEAELAAVVAHEVSHVVARHGIKRLQSAMGVAAAYELVFGDDDNKLVELAVGIGMTLAFSKYSRDNEREADQFGIHYMVQAGYNPQGAVAMFETLASLGSAGSPGVFEGLMASHPETQERIANAKNQILRLQLDQSRLRTNRDQYQQMLARLPQSAN